MDLDFLLHDGPIPLLANLSEDDKIAKGSSCCQVTAAPTSISMYYYESFMSIYVYKTVNASYFLDNFHVLVLSLCLFVIFDNFDTQYEWIKKTLAYISPSMIGVYILHDGIFYFIASAYNLSDVTLRFTLLLSVFAASVLLSRALLLNKYTRALSHSDRKRPDCDYLGTCRSDGRLSLSTLVVVARGDHQRINIVYGFGVHWCHFQFLNVV